jgi:hypothetical protein
MFPLRFLWVHLYCTDFFPHENEREKRTFSVIKLTFFLNQINWVVERPFYCHFHSLECSLKLMLTAMFFRLKMSEKYTQSNISNISYYYSRLHQFHSTSLLSYLIKNIIISTSSKASQIKWEFSINFRKITSVHTYVNSIKLTIS